MKISQAELQVRKTEAFFGFANLQREFLADKSLLKKLEAKDAKTLAKLTKQILDLGTGLFFFASDKTVRKYGAWRGRSATGEISGVDVLRQPVPTEQTFDRADQVLVLRSNRLEEAPRVAKQVPVQQDAVGAEDAEVHRPSASRPTRASEPEWC